MPPPQKKQFAFIENIITIIIINIINIFLLHSAPLDTLIVLKSFEPTF